MNVVFLGLGIHGQLSTSGEPISYNQITAKINVDQLLPHIVWSSSDHCDGNLNSNLQSKLSILISRRTRVCVSVCVLTMDGVCLCPRVYTCMCTFLIALAPSSS